MSDLFTPPRFFKNVSFHRHTQRSVGWLELFYDLVYVATLIQIGNFLSDNHTLLGFGQFLVMITVVWWAWTGETFYQNRHVVDDLWHRVLVFTQMFAVATIGLSVSEAFGDLYVQFTLAYVATRFVLILMYVRVMNKFPETNELTRLYLIGFSTGTLIWLGSLLLPAEYHWVGWLIGIGFELAVPFFSSVQDEQRQSGIDYHHVSERFGIFTIIVLGEAFVKILDDAQGLKMGISQVQFSIGGLLVLYSLWWLYFNDTAGKVIDLQHRVKPFAWIYSHLPLAASLVAFGVGAKKLYASTFTYADQPVNPDYRLLYTAALVIYLVALALIDYGLDDEETPKSQTLQMIIHLVSAGIVAVIGLFVTGVNPIVFVSLMAIVMVAQVAVDIYLEKDIHPEMIEHSQTE